MVKLVKLFQSFLVKHFGKWTLLMIKFTVRFFMVIFSSVVSFAFMIFTTVMLISMERATVMVSHVLFFVNFINFGPIFRSLVILILVLLMMLVLVMFPFRSKLTILRGHRRLHEISRVEITIRVLLFKHFHIVRRRPNTNMVGSAHENKN